MASNIPTKNIPLYFYYMTVEQSQSSVPYDAQNTVNEPRVIPMGIENLLDYVVLNCYYSCRCFDH